LPVSRRTPLTTHTAMLARRRAHHEKTLPTQDFVAEG
jgi:hypothetical protein